MSQSPSLPSVKQIETEGLVFLPFIKAPGSTKSFILGGAGVRGLQIQERFVKFTVIGVYLEDCAVETLAVKWKGKTDEELAGSLEFYRDIVTGSFEKFMRVTMILPLTGSQYSEKVTENCVALCKSIGTYTDAEAKAVKTFMDVFKDQTFPPGASILFTLSPLGALTISFSKDGSIPEMGNATIENKQLSEAILESMIGKHGVSPDAKKSLAERLSELFKVEEKEETVENGESEIVTPGEIKEITT